MNSNLIKFNTVILILLFLTTSSIEAQQLNWQKVGQPSAARLITFDYQTNLLYALNNDGSIYKNDDGGNDNAWERVTQIPNNVRSFSVNDNYLWYLTSQRDVYIKDLSNSNNTAQKLDNLHSADKFQVVTRIIGGTCIGIALNQDKTLWNKTYSNEGSTIRQWNNIGRPNAANQIAVSQRGLLALNNDKTLWLNKFHDDRIWQEGKGNWTHIGTPSQAEQIAVRSHLGSFEIYALNQDKTLYRTYYHSDGTSTSTPSEDFESKFHTLKVVVIVDGDDINGSELSLSVRTTDGKQDFQKLSTNLKMQDKEEKVFYFNFFNGGAYKMEDISLLYLQYKAASTGIFGAKDQSDIKVKVYAGIPSSANQKLIASSEIFRYNQNYSTNLFYVNTTNGKGAGYFELDITTEKSNLRAHETQGSELHAIVGYKNSSNQSITRPVLLCSKNSAIPNYQRLTYRIPLHFLEKNQIEYLSLRTNIWSKDYRAEIGTDSWRIKNIKVYYHGQNTPRVLVAEHNNLFFGGKVLNVPAGVGSGGVPNPRTEWERPHINENGTHGSTASNDGFKDPFFTKPPVGGGGSSNSSSNSSSSTTQPNPYHDTGSPRYDTDEKILLMTSGN